MVKSQLRWNIGVSVFALLLAFGHALMPERFDTPVLMLLVFAALPWCIPFLRAHFRSIEAFGGKFEFLKERIDQETSRLDELFRLSIGEKLLNHLGKLKQPGGYGEFFVGTALPRELEHLENLGYIQFKGELKGLDDFLNKMNHQHGKNLSDFVELTDAGRTFMGYVEASRDTKINAPPSAP